MPKIRIAAHAFYGSNLNQMPTFTYTNEQVLHFLKVKKTLAIDEFEFTDFERGKRAKWGVFSPEITLAKLNVRISAPITSDPTTFHAALLVDFIRIRGVDYCEIARKYRYKIKIPEGWHQNIDYPNRPKDNRHDPLPFPKITDLRDFARKVCELWNIELPEKERGLLL